MRVGLTMASVVLLAGMSLPAQASGGSPATGVVTAAVAAHVGSSAPAPGGRLAVGDSLMVSVAERMRAEGFEVHAEVGRQFSTAPGIVRGYGSALPSNVVIELGTNGTISLSDCRSVVRTAGRERRVFLVTNRVPRSWQGANRRTVRVCNRSFAGPRVRVINWYRHSSGQPQWFAGDGIHLSTSGQQAFARLIDRAVDRKGLT